MTSDPCISRNSPPMRRLQSHLYLYEKDQITRNQIGVVQQDLQEINREYRWLVYMTLTLLPKILEIYKSLLNSFGNADPNDLLKHCQATLDQDLEVIFEDFDIFQKESNITRQKEVEGYLNAKFDKFLNDSMSPSITNIQNEIKKFEIQTSKVTLEVLSQEALGPLEKEILERQKKFLEEVERINTSFMKIFQKDNSNDLFNNYRKYFYEYEYKKGESEISEKVLEKGKQVCQKYFQFFPKIVYAIDQFKSEIKINYLEAHLYEDIPPPKDYTFKETSLQNIKSIHDLLAYDIKLLGITQVELETQLNHLDLKSIKGQRELKNIDAYIVSKKQGKHDIWYALKNGLLEEVKIFAETPNFKVNAHHALLGLTPLHYAMGNDNVEIIKFLLEKNGNQTAYNALATKETPFLYTPLHMAAALCNKDILSLCLQNFQTPYFFSFTRPILGKELINLPTKPIANGSAFSVLHFVINPKLMFKDSDKQWQQSALPTLKTLITNGADIYVPNTDSAFVFAIDEFLKKSSDKKTISELINYFLQKDLSLEDIKYGIRSLVRHCNEQEKDKVSILLLESMLKLVYFKSEKGLSFLKGVLLTTSTGCSTELLQNHIKNFDTVISPSSSPVVIKKSASDSVVNPKFTQTKNPTSPIKVRRFRLSGSDTPKST